MKFALAMMFLVSVAAVAQDVRQEAPRVIELPLPKTITMSNGVSVPLTVSPDLDGSRLMPQVKANYILRDGMTVTASGEVELKTRTLTIRADHVVMDAKTGEIQASGNVRIIPVLPIVHVVPTPETK